MTSDNKRALLLLILIGIAIYFILFSEGFNPLNAINNYSENFNSILFNSEQPTFNSEEPTFNSEEPTFNSEQPTFNSEEPIFNTDQLGINTDDSGFNSVQPEFNQSQPYQSQNQVHQQVHEDEPYIPSSVIHEIVNQTVPESNKNNAIYNFGANDESENLYGTSLSDAFLPPISDDSNTKTVDFKKQNMDNYNAKDFLPKEVNDEWFETDFSLAKYQLNDDKLINTEKYIIGINTVGESLKNASYDIRGTIPNPKFVVSPWNNSTYEPDFNLKPLC